MTKEAVQTFTRRITEANRTGLITVVYEITLAYLEEAKEALAKRDFEEYEFTLKKARACVDNLSDCLDLQYEISWNLQELYLFCKRQLICASSRRDPVYIGYAERVISKLHDAWVQIEDTDDSMPEMENTQTVYAGLTYGRGTLNENVADPAANRGIQA